MGKNLVFEAQAAPSVHYQLSKAASMPYGFKTRRAASGLHWQPVAQSGGSQKSIRDQATPLDNQYVPEMHVDSGSVRPVLIPRMVVGRNVRLQRTKLKHHGVDGSSESFGGRRQHCIDIRRENIGEDDKAASNSANLTACGLQVWTQAPGPIAGC